MSTAFIDSNVILYLLSGNPAKADRAEALLDEGGAISVQVLNEIVSVCLRKLKMPWGEIDAMLLADISPQAPLGVVPGREAAARKATTSSTWCNSHSINIEMT